MTLTPQPPSPLGKGETRQTRPAVEAALSVPSAANLARVSFSSVVRTAIARIRRAPALPSSPVGKGARGLGLILALSLLLLAGCGIPGTVPTGGSLPGEQPMPSPTPLPVVRFPQDEAPHTDLTEWWYYTGHMQAHDAQGHEHDYGFELTFFQTLRGQLPPYYAAHFAISDITRGQFHYDERAGFEPFSAIPPAGSTQGFNLALGGWALQGVNGHDKLSATMTEYSFALSTADQLPHPVLHGGDGIIDFGSAGFSYYYSRPLLAITGTLTDHGTQLQVTGTAWMDHQWGNFISVNGAGWEWLSIQLADHTEYMLYDIRDAQNKSTALVGTAVSADGTVHEIPSSAISIEQLGTWTSPHTKGVYPSGWRVTLNMPGVAITLTPQLRDQELVTAKSTGVAYWEGAVSITGQSSGKSVTGKGYIELTGYATIPSSAQGSPLP